MSFATVIVIGIILFLVISFIACAFLFPELVGIAGRRAKEIEGKHHRDENSSPVDEDETR